MNKIFSGMAIVLGLVAIAFGVLGIIAFQTLHLKIIPASEFECYYKGEFKGYKNCPVELPISSDFCDGYWVGDFCIGNKYSRATILED